MTTTLRQMEERLFDVEDISEREYGDVRTGYLLTAARLRRSVTSRKTLLRAFEKHFPRLPLSDYERRCIRADAEDLAEFGDTRAERSKWAGVAFAMMSGSL